MALPGVDTEQLDGQLGIIAPDNSATSAKIGACTAGTVDEVYSFEGTDTQRVRSTLGAGPLVDAVILHLLASKGKRVLAVRGAASTAGTNGSVTRTGTGPSPGPTVSGAPDDDYQMVIEIGTGGAVGTATFRLSLDGGDTWTPYLTTATYVVGNGNTISWTAGTYVAADLYTYDCVGPKNTVSDTQAALDALIASPLKWSFAHVVGFTADGATCATLCTAVQAKMVAAEAVHKYVWTIIEAPPVAPASIASAFASFVGQRIMLAAGFAEVVNDVSGRTDKRSSGRLIAARLARNPISVAPLRDASDARLEAVGGVAALMPAGASESDGYLDSANNSTLDSARCSTLMHFDGEAGFYIAHGYMMAATGSDFALVQHRRVMDRALEVGYARALQVVQKRLARDPATGFILEGAAVAIEGDITAAIKAALVDEGHADRVRTLVNRSDDLGANPTVRIGFRVVPKIYGDRVELTGGFAVTLA